MSLFNRKRRDEDSDQVRLASADHSWWTGEEQAAPAPGADDDFGANPFSLEPAEGADDDVVDLDDRFAAGGDVAAGDDEVGDASGELMSGIAQALSDYAYAAPVEDDHAWPMGQSMDDSEREAVEQALFARDGLPEEDHLTELLGTLGLEGDSDWVDIARAHRRLVTTSASGRPEWEQDRQRRAANQAYACLRLFHH